MRSNQQPNQTMKTLIDASMMIVIAGAQKYIQTHNLKANPDVLTACCKSWLKIQLPIAMRDAKEALGCGMEQVAEATFKATLIQAGIEAAKEASLPSAQFDHVVAIGQA